MRGGNRATPARWVRGWVRDGIGLAVLIMAVLFPRLAEACSVCWGASDSPQTQGTNNAILFLLLIVVLVLSGMGGFFITLMRRSRLAALPEEGAPEEGGFGKGAACEKDDALGAGGPVGSRPELQETRNTLHE